MRPETTPAERMREDCARLAGSDRLEGYLLGRLTGAEREALELHYFECEACHRELLLLEAAKGELGRRRRARPLPAWAGLAAAAALTAVALAALLRPGGPAPAGAPSPPPSSPPAALDLAALARFEPPRYDPARLRGDASRAERAFADGMARYTRGDFAGAVAPLARAAGAGSEPGPRFFLGVSRVLAGETGSGLADLRAVAALGETPYLEDARFFAAKALLARGDAAEAREELAAVVALDGDRAAEARALLGRLGGGAR